MDGGYGDQICSIRYIKLFVERYTKVIINLDPSLLEIFNKTEFLSHIQFSTRVIEDEYEFYVAAHEIPDYYEITNPSQNLDFPYVTPNPKVVEKNRPLIEKSAQSKLKIGIHWQGNLHFNNRDMKSPNAEDMLFLAKYEILFSLQRDMGTNTLPKDNGVVDLQTGPASWSHTLAAMSLLDIIVTNDSSIAHLAGALNKKAIVIVPVSPATYWFSKNETSVWYPSVTIAKQTKYQNWQSALNVVDHWTQEKMYNSKTNF